jgi:hypothetical protein
MLRIDQDNSFTAQWNKSNMRLNSNRGGCLENMIRKVLKFIFYIPNCIVAACINPRSESQFHSSPRLATNYGNFTKKIITPDEVSLTANVHIVAGANATTPTILLFNPLGANASIHYELKNNLLEKRCNVITFDYRGFGTTRRADDLVVDGESVYQYATNELGVDKDKVHFYGFSLGGALAAQVKALHPESEGKYVGDRPFKSIFSLITENCCIERLGPIVKKITSLISAVFIALPIYLLGWEWDGKKAVVQLNGNKRVIYHPNDYLVPFKASLASECPLEQLIQLDPSETGPSTHFSTIADKNTAEGNRATSLISNFLSS